MTISNSEKIKLVMAKDWWETEDLGGKLEKVKVSDGPVGLRCLAITDSWENDSIYPSVAYPCYQMLSQAVARALSGQVNPSGRLTETYAYSIQDIPSENTRRDEACMYYDETWHVGYRHFTTENVPVLYPFGYGLSYTEFAYSNLQVCGHTISVDVENIGAVDGQEVVQLYVATGRKDAPVRELKAFQKVFIKAGEKVTVTMQLDQDAFTCYNEQNGCWQVETGKYTLQICKNANQILLEQAITL